MYTNKIENKQYTTNIKNIKKLTLTVMSLVNLMEYLWWELRSYRTGHETPAKLVVQTESVT